MIVSLISIILLLISRECLAKLPSDLAPCQYEDTLCVTRIASNLINNYPEGRSDMGLPPLDPFRAESIVINEGDNRTFSFDLRFHNVEVRGISGLKLEKVVGFGKNPAKSKFELYARLPKLGISGQYLASGNLLFLPIQGNGTVNVIVENIKGALKFRPKVVIKNGTEFLEIEKIKIRIEPEKANINLTNLFDGDPELSKSVLDFINQNWLEVWEEVSQPIVHMAEDMAKEVIQSIFSMHSYDDFFTND